MSVRLFCYAYLHLVSGEGPYITLNLFIILVTKHFENYLKNGEKFITIMIWYFSHVVKIYTL